MDFFSQEAKIERQEVPKAFTQFVESMPLELYCTGFNDRPIIWQKYIHGEDKYFDSIHVFCPKKIVLIFQYETAISYFNL